MKTLLPTSSILMAVAALAASVACGPSSTDSLLGDDPTANGGTGGTGGGNWGNGGGGPAYNADGGAQAPVAAQALRGAAPGARAEVRRRLPHRRHQREQLRSGSPDPDEYNSIKAYPGIVTDDVYTSKLLNRPNNHPTSCLIDPGNETLLAAVTTWLTAEAVALAGIPLPTTDVTRRRAASTSRRRDGITGAKITFTATPLGDLAPVRERDARRPVDDRHPHRVAHLRDGADHGPRGRQHRLLHRRTSASRPAARAIIAGLLLLQLDAGQQAQACSSRRSRRRPCPGDAGASSALQGRDDVPEQRGAHARCRRA